MKKTIKTFIDRLRNAWSIIKGDDYIFVSYEKGVSEQYMLYTTSYISGVRWFSKSNSIMMLTKEADGRLTYCYDCKSEEDFDDLINMEVK